MVKRIATAGFIAGIVFLLIGCKNNSPGLEVNTNNFLEDTAEREFRNLKLRENISEEMQVELRSSLENISSPEELNNFIEQIKSGYSLRFTELLLDDADILNKIKNGIRKALSND